MLNGANYRRRQQQAETHSSLEELRRRNVVDLGVSDHLMKIAKTLNATEERFSNIQSSISLSQLERSFSQFSADFEPMAKSSAILQSLRFESMTARHGRITEAHRRTFDWIFLTKSLPADDPRSSIQFSSWLKYGKGIYWITGKPGQRSPFCPHA